MLAGVAAYFQKGCGSIKADYKKIVNKFGTDKILIVILAGVLLMVAAFPSGHSSASKDTCRRRWGWKSQGHAKHQEFNRKSTGKR